ncbi:MAG: response regulator [Gammaproteobacteria bacterium]|nr:response regulator [Gammaproteobacteria bacterium]MBT3489052.1 response regulator [Gammaproteobacteria bacterium]MBT3719585.1 response regulator [Gammaproteobacteria bacterium]MBT3845707.1 response regulator [Gammaproteobacteria bacterium]MBT3892641.1 response regulator [Gammaproteobacteria bacterium]
MEGIRTHLKDFIDTEEQQLASLKELTRSIHENSEILHLTLGGALILTILLGWLSIEVRVIRPLMRLTKDVVQMGEAQRNEFKCDEEQYRRSCEEVMLLKTEFCRMHQNVLSYTEELEESHNDMEQVIERERTANQAKDDFLAMMSHELRTPLTSIIGNSELLAEQELDTTKSKIIGSIEAAGKNQLALVNDILDMSKIQSGKFTVENLPYDFSDLIQKLHQMLSERAEAAGLQFSVEQQNCESFLLMGDSQRISQILINLLTNAIKFTESGRVALTTWAENGLLVFNLEDTGIGMSPETVNRLFNRFEQAEQSISRRFGGTGLGLYISHNLADLMGGCISVMSKKGMGSVFQLLLPYVQSDTPVRQHERSIDESMVDCFSGEVLIAEDTPEIQLLLRRILEKMGLTVSVANNGKEAVALATTQSFGLILMDMQMPVMDGIEATQRLREQHLTIPVIALTANVMQKHREAFHQAGCDGFLSKPIDKVELKRTLKQYLKPAGMQAEQSAVAEEVDDELLGIFRESATQYRSTLIQALSEKEWDTVRAIAHTIKGSGASFGFPGLSHMGEDICDAIDLQETRFLHEKVMQLLLELGKIAH